MQPLITSEVVVAYAQCPRKAYLLMFSPDKGELHEYVQILEQQRQENQERYLNRPQQTHADVHPYSLEHLRKGSEVLINARLQVDGFAADCGVLTRVEGKSTFGKHRYEPTIFVGTHSTTKEQKLALSFVGHVLGRLQHTPPMAGRILGMDGKAHSVKLDKASKTLTPLLAPLQEWTTVDSPAPPPLVLNKHCPLCPFQRLCHAQAEQEDNLSLLHGVTARAIRQYEKMGIFTVRQLSYVFKPRKQKKRSKKPPPVTHRVELQALAIRENKIYLQELPTLSRQLVELFLDIEGVPDRGVYYLIGLLVRQEDTMTHYAFWADTDHDERQIWQQFVDMVTHYPDAPIYHYGSYERRAIATLAKRYQTDGESLTKRLINVNSHIHGKVYFPGRSNGLKEIGRCIGAQWTAPDASGLQSLVWRHQWDQTQDGQYRQSLTTYNKEDCLALQVLIETLSKIKDSADTLPEVNFTDTRKPQLSAEGHHVHSQLTEIVKFSYFHYDKKKIRFRLEAHPESSHNKFELHQRKAEKWRHMFLGIKRRAKTIVTIPPDERCPTCGYRSLKQTTAISRRYVMDLVSTRSGLRKTIIQYDGIQGYCRRCDRNYAPHQIRRDKKNRVYRNKLGAWLVYQRVGLRLPYESIIELFAEQFKEDISISQPMRFLKQYAEYYGGTEQRIVEQMLRSPFIHVDETKVNIKGANWYVWVFTDERHVVFKLTETREATLVHDLLCTYPGILISDFYPGYDAVACRQQKCWVHLIRDLNGDLKTNPFDKEYEHLVVQIRNLMVPIMEAVQRYGLKRRHLHKFERHVEQFYQEVIRDKTYTSDLARTYQKRFLRYQESLFAFLTEDAIPWHNNTAERAIRSFAIQRDVSKSPFQDSTTQHYLVLLGIRQTCRFQGKSFFKFLFSGETDLEQFAARKRKRSQATLR
jgi:predicted RecB family nuclease